MSDIFLELSDEVVAQYARHAMLLGTTSEALMCRAIEAAAPKHIHSVAAQPMEDELIAKAAEIENEYRRLGYGYGWRFITCPYINRDTAKLLLITLNPGGRGPHGPPWSQEDGSAYRVEAWDGRLIGKSKLQLQVQAMFSLLGLRDEEVFSAHFVPFRSPSWNELDRRVDALTFANRLWQWLLPQLTFERVICMGKEMPTKAIVDLLQATFEISLPVGWGKITADIYRLPDGRPLIALPHTSRFSIFGRPEGEEALLKLFSI